MALPGMLVGIVGGGIASSVIDPFTRSFGYAANYTTKDEIPSASDAISSYYRHGLTSKELSALLANHGILSFGQSQFDDPSISTPQGEKRRRLWNKIIEANRPRMSAETAIQLYRMGKISKTDLSVVLAHSGVPRHDIDAIIDSLINAPLEAGTLAALLRRNQLAIETAHIDLSRLGILDKTLRENLLKLTDFVPTPHDLILFMARDVEDEQTIDWSAADADFDKKFAGETLKWARWQGLDRDKALRFWRAHYHYPSPTQLYTMLHRLRPERIAEYQDLVPGTRVVTVKDVANVLKIDDRHPDWVNELTAISYHPVGRRDLRMLYRRRVWGVPQMVSALQDNGYSPKDAADLANGIAKDVRQLDWGIPVRMTRDQILEGLKIGALTVEHARALLGGWGLSEDEISLTIENMRVADVINRIRLIQRATKKMLLLGAITIQQARQEMLFQGVTSEKAEELLYIWAIELRAGRRHSSAQTILRWLFRGLLSLIEAQLRLSNLGFPEDEIRLMIASVEQDILLARIKAAKQAATTRKQMLREMERESRQLRSEYERSRRELARHGTPASISRWASKGLIDRDAAINRLVALDWPLEDAQRQIDDACRERECKTNGTP